MLFSDAQYARDPASITDPIEARTLPAPFDPSAKIEWSPVWSLRDRRFRYLPTSLLYFFYRGPGEINADSNGCAAGNTLAEAIVQGFLELVERDSYAIWWYNRSQRTRSGPRPVRRFLHPRSANPACRHRAAGSGCSTSPAIWEFRALWRWHTGWTTGRKMSSSDPARISMRELRCCARGHGVEPVPVHGPHERWGRGQIEP